MVCSRCRRSIERDVKHDPESAATLRERRLLRCHRCPNAGADGSAASHRSQHPPLGSTTAASGESGTALGAAISCPLWKDFLKFSPKDGSFFRVQAVKAPSRPPYLRASLTPTVAPRGGAGHGRLLPATHDAQSACARRTSRW